MAKLKVAVSLLGSLLHLPIGARVIGVAVEDDRTLVLELEGDDVPDVPRVRAVFHQICKLEPVE